jgi:hypothetical protein
MLQRIQTVYLLIVVVLTSLLFFMPLAVVGLDGKFGDMTVLNLYPVFEDNGFACESRGIIGIVVAIILLTIATVFFYKKRPLQVNMLLINILLKLVFYGIFAYAYLEHTCDAQNATVNLKLAITFPAVAIILDILAVRRIKADEALVRSLDRLR